MRWIRKRARIKVTHSQRNQMSDKESYFHPLGPPQSQMLLQGAPHHTLTLFGAGDKASVCFRGGTNPVQTFPLAWVRISAWAERGLTCLVAETVFPTLEFLLQGPWRCRLPSEK